MFRISAKGGWVVGLRAQAPIGHALPGADLVLVRYPTGALGLRDATGALVCENRHGEILDAFCAGVVTVPDCRWDGVSPQVLWCGEIGIACLDGRAAIAPEQPTWTLRWFDGHRRSIGPCNVADARNLAVGLVAMRWVSLGRGVYTQG